MRKHAGGLQIGAYIVGGLVGLYLLGGVAIYADIKHGSQILNSLPRPVLDALGLLYVPVFKAIFRLWPELNPSFFL